MSLSTSAQRLQALRLPNADSTLDNDDKFAALGFIGTETTAPTGISDALKSLIFRHPTPDASVDNADKFAVLGLYDSDNASGPIIEDFQLRWTIDPTFTEGDALPDGRVDALLNSFIARLEGENSNIPRKIAGRSRGFRRGFVVEYKGELIPFASMSEVQAFLERSPVAKLVVHEVESPEPEVYESLSLSSEQLKAIYGERPRLVERKPYLEQFTLPERTRFVQSNVNPQATFTIKERKRYVTSDPVASERIDMPERTKYIAPETSEEDPLMKVLRKREK